MRRSPQLLQIQKTLASKADRDTVAFLQKMVPGNSKFYGVKTPELNEIVRQYKSYSFTLAGELWVSGAHEEKLVAIKILEKTGKNDPEQLLKLFKTFSNQIDNWAVCDGLGMQLLRGIVKTHPEKIFKLADQFSRSGDLWKRRLSLVMIEWYTRLPIYHSAINKLVARLEDDEEYYVKKAVAWLKRNLVNKK